MDYQRTDPIIHMHVEMEWVLPGAYEPLKAAKERATTGTMYTNSSAIHTFQMWKVRIY